MINGYGMLTGDEIYHAIQSKKIEIEPFNMENLGPNSYNVHISNRLMTLLLNNGVIDMNQSVSVIAGEIPENGFTIMPGKVYLIPLKERIHTDEYVPMVYGRSTCGRIGLSVYQAANFGDIGFNGVWTLQITSVYPTIIYPGASLAQVSFETCCGNVAKLYNGKYQAGASAPQYDQTMGKSNQNIYYNSDKEQPHDQTHPQKRR